MIAIIKIESIAKHVLCIASEVVNIALFVTNAFKNTTIIAEYSANASVAVI